MKYIVAIIRPEKLEAVQQALADVDVYLMTVSDVRGCGRQRGFTEVYRAQEHVVRLVPKLKLEIAVNEPFVEAAVDAIVRAGRSGDYGQVGDGKIFVFDLEDCIQIRTGETGMVAIGP
ncbi:MAG TPA: P-II family nitrogen regulator [Phycisphaerae bacterium]|nr:P-II family nitrogen regulator [Phycisphaerae bacterium]HOQ84916.1 P-II family nitrogen regulator [Phycisphaerae bacterium]HPU27248.1 P-II family nitrogen regulator [Phycisphaerae bacterium]